MSGDQDYNQINDTANKAILQKLIDDTEDPDITAVIKCYTIGATGTEIRKEAHKLKVPQLKKAGTYLGLYPEGDTTKVKEDIIVILSPASMVYSKKDLCGICCKYFNNDLTDNLFTEELTHVLKGTSINDVPCFLPFLIYLPTHVPFGPI